MKTLTPDLTLKKLGWAEARKSLKETRSITAPLPPPLPRFYWKHPKSWPRYIGNMRYWFKCWLTWPLRTVQYWIVVWKHSRTDYVKEYTALAKTGMDSRQIFRQTRRRMHLSEDEIFEAGNRILRGEGLPPFQHAKEIDVGEQIR
jgi:hypothetical protein